MKKENFKSILVSICFLAASILMLSSCNRGYGCPYDTKVLNISKIMNLTLGK